MNSIKTLRPILATLVLILLIAVMNKCGKPSAQQYAAKFCTCSEDISRATVQLEAKQMDQATFDQIKTEHDVCMGEDSPLDDLGSEKDSLHFFQDFLHEVKKQCPNIGRNYGYDLD
ncbi:MAG: hypothetical protein GY810_24175 [Aureispira sp.]|nr:hypothetical protein [Aureispira sp.]